MTHDEQIRVYDEYIITTPELYSFRQATYELPNDTYIQVEGDETRVYKSLSASRTAYFKRHQEYKKMGYTIKYVENSK